MKKQKKLFIFSGIVICLITITLVIINFVNSDNVIYESDNANAGDNRVISSNALTMMYETEAGSGEYTVASDNTWPQDGYVFNERLSGCENGSKLTWDDERKAVILSTTVSDRCYVYFDVEVITLADYIINEVYTGTDGENGLYYHDADLANGAQDNSYRYSGANPNNYVCFGPGAEAEGTCANDNLYRIIGLFDDDKDGNYQIKLIKADYTTSDMLGTNGRDYVGAYDMEDGSYYKGNMTQSDIATYRWNYDTSVSSYGSNNWTTSEFNKINLNTNYWNYLGTTWQNLIAQTTWYLGGMTSYNNTAKAFYDGERNNAGYGSNPTTYTDEIGLMYVSDYGYAASPDAWTTNLYDYNNSTITSNNWMYMGLYEWPITPNSSYSYYVFDVRSTGYLYSTSAIYGYAARPVFYLESNVSLQGGSGTSSDPYRLSV